ncbi:hypothetical protein B0H14DRAFT_2581074 [Mycena olivaceomarginata]|nr:hypothetical protein B0H14DRAFT_2581074 [Mycena olivaceomarginata]
MSLGLDEASPPSPTPPPAYSPARTPTRPRPTAPPTYTAPPPNPAVLAIGLRPQTRHKEFRLLTYAPFVTPENIAPRPWPIPSSAGVRPESLIHGRRLRLSFLAVRFGLQQGYRTRSRAEAAYQLAVAGGWTCDLRKHGQLVDHSLESVARDADDPCVECALNVLGIEGSSSEKVLSFVEAHEKFQRASNRGEVHNGFGGFGTRSFGLEQSKCGALATKYGALATQQVEPCGLHGCLIQALCGKTPNFNAIRSNEGDG